MITAPTEFGRTHRSQGQFNAAILRLTRSAFTSTAGEQIFAIGDRDLTAARHWEDVDMFLWIKAAGKISLSTDGIGQVGELVADGFRGGFTQSKAYRLTYSWDKLSGADNDFAWYTSAGQFLGDIVTGTDTEIEFIANADATELEIRSQVSSSSADFLDVSLLELDPDGDLLIATNELVLTDGHVKNLLSSFNGIQQEAEYFGRMGVNNPVEVAVNNKPFGVDRNGVPVRLSDLIDGFALAQARLYLWSGNNVTALSDCLLRFTGFVSRVLATNSQTMTLLLQDDASALDTVLLPKRQIKDVFPGAPEDNLDKRIPLVWGTFDENVDENDFVTNGLVPGLVADFQDPPKYVFADHVVKAMTRLMMRFTSDGPIQEHPVDPTFNVDDDGLATTTHPDQDDDGLPGWNAKNNYTPDGTVPAAYNTIDLLDASDPPLNKANATDGDYATQATIIANIDEQNGVAYFALDTSDSADVRTSISTGTDVGVSIQIKNLTANPLGGRQTSALLLYYGTSGGDDLRVRIWGDPVFPSTWQPDVWRTYQLSDPDELAKIVDSGPTLLNLVVAIESSGAAEPASPDDLMSSIGEVRVQVTENVPDIEIPFCEMTGRAFGSWIDDGAWSNSLNEGDLIEDAPYIIASILIDELGLAIGDLDAASFDAAVNSEIPTSRIIFGSEETKTAREWIGDILSAHTSALVWNAAGKARLVDLRAASPSISRTIEWEEIAGGLIEITDTEGIVNSGTFGSRWQSEYGLFRDSLQLKNERSILRFGDMPFEFDWKAINGDAAIYLASLVLSNTKGLYSIAHKVVSFATKGYLNADIEVGDWIKLDSTTTDPHLLLNGTSWAGINLLVSKAYQLMNSTFIECIQFEEAPETRRISITCAAHVIGTRSTTIGCAAHTTGGPVPP